MKAKTAREVARLSRKVMLQNAPVRKPGFQYRCWGLVRIPAQNRNPYPVFDSCTKDAREGHLTCWHHRKWDDAARNARKDES